MRKRSARIAWLVCAATFALLAIGAAIAAATWSVSLPPGTVPRGVVLLVAPVFAVLGAVTVSRVPGNAIGHLFLYVGLAGSAQLMAEQIAFAAEVWPVLTPFAPWAALAYYAIGLVAAFAWLPYLIALFPTGRFARHREKRAVLLASIAFVGMLASGFVLIDRLPAPFSKYANPLAHPELMAFAYAIELLATAAYIAALAIVVLASARRFRGSQGIERQQLKWFAYAGALTAAIGTAVWIGFFVEYIAMGQAVLDAPPVELRALFALSIVAFIVLPTAVALAIFRYRLYDIDILINRTVLYVSVSAILVIAFAAFSAAAQRVAEGIMGQRSDLVTIASAVVVSLGFGPLRRRIQPFLDRLLPGRGMLALLMTDIVGSTERVVALGDERWRTVLEAYRAAVRRELARFGGREVDTAGDGFFATFERPPKAVACAMAMRDSLHALGLDSRTGVHAGECELRGERVSGLNVIIVARIMAAAGANEIVSSSALRALVASDFRFHDHGVASLKGVPGEWPLSLIAEAPLPA